MATWTTVADALLDEGKPGRSTDIKALRDNITAMAERAASSPPINAFSATVELTAVSSSPWTVPAGVTSIEVECIGAGGGGGGALDPGTFVRNYAGGGGGGGTVVAVVSVTPGSTVPFSVGAGGAGGVGNLSGAAGGNTTWDGGVISATGGLGGGANPLTTSGDTPGGAGQGGSGPANCLIVRGGNGRHGHPAHSLNTGLSGNGGNSSIGMGARGKNAAGNGESTISSDLGAGGAGAGADNAGLGSNNGGLGRVGIIRIRY